MSTEDSPRSGAELEAREVPDRQGDDTEDVAAGAACAAAQLLVQATFPSPGPLQVKGNLAENWREWSQLWRSYETVTRMTSQPDEYRLASFITCIGRAGLRIYNSLPFAEEAEKTDMARVIELMEAHCVGEANVTYERFVLDQRRQNHGEPFDKFLTSVREQAQRCRFGDQESDMIRDRIVCGVHDQGLRKQLLQRKNLSLADCVDLCRAYEATEKRAKTMSGADTEVHRVQKQYVPKSSKVKSKRYQSKDTVKVSAKTECQYCGLQHAKGRVNCPANGKQCSKCGKLNHYARKCRSQPSVKSRVHCAQESVSSDEAEELMTLTLTGQHDVNAVRTAKYRPQIMATMLLEGKSMVQFQVDTGASCNVIRRADVPKHVKLESTPQVLTLYDRSKVTPVGRCTLRLKNPRNNRNYRAHFVVVDRAAVSILGSRAAQQMQLVTVQYDRIQLLDAPSTHPAVETDKDLMTVENVSERYPQVFDGKVGSLGQPLQLDIDETVTPVQIPVRRVPVAMRQPLKAELDKLERTGVIEKISRPTKWMSSMVAVKKANGTIRICLDPKPLNRALKRSRYQIPVLDDILPQLANAKVFTVADVKSGFWHIELDQKSRELTTFGTPFGRYCYKRMPFGISVAPEVFQRRLHEMVADIDGVWAIADDILIAGIGDTDESAVADHEKKLKQLLRRCQERGVRLNRDKLSIRKTNVPYMGHILTTEGVRPDPAKVKAILAMDRPNDVAAVRRLVGVVTYLAKYLRNLTDISEPLHQLTRRDVEWKWTNQQERAFEQIKAVVSSAPVLRYFSAEDSVTLQCDASSVGLGVALMQNGQPVAYASRRLTDAEERYAQIEKELLAIVYGLERFDQYTYGRAVDVESDHKPLEVIAKKPLQAAPKRLQRMLLRIQRYDITIRYKKGTDMHLADTLSRAPVESDRRSREETNREDIMAIDADEEQDNALLSLKPETVQKIRQATIADDGIKQLKEMIFSGWPDHKKQIPRALTPYFGVRDQLVVQNGLVFCGDRLLVPDQLRSYMLDRVHSTHLGINGCIRRAKQSIWWPGMTGQIRDKIESCEECNKYPVKQSKETLVSHHVPERPWVKVGVDLFEYRSKHYLVISDYQSNFLEMERLYETTSKSVIKSLKQQFARHGIPEHLFSDNGPQFQSQEFAHFADVWNFQHNTASPGYPKSNGKAENAVKVAKRILKKSREAGTDVYLALLDYRNTPSEGLATSPAQRLFNRRTRTLLPTKASLLEPKMNPDESDHQRVNKEKQKANYDRNARDLPQLRPGDTVRVQPLTQKRDVVWPKAVVTNVLPNRSYGILTEHGKELRRNRVHLRKVKEEPVRIATQQVKDTAGGRNDNHAPQQVVQSKTTKTPKRQIENRPVSTTTSQDNSTRTTRSGRVVKSPKYLQDYVT
ncbi:uncharacterized protein K02A2.6-like [Corticium candelabrum]|uniref:uncharacterized protein K02A2.6-like n=1 Tax=Corticium candelabrum TaxID=121492 RepID=UPI002E255AF4|nr:uncharacterized protein K02A2.6-like [Corticium candelabrum]